MSVQPATPGGSIDAHLRIGVDVLEKLSPSDRVGAIRLLVQHDELAGFVGDLAAEHEDRVADRGVAIARAVGGHAPAPEVLSGLEIFIAASRSLPRSLRSLMGSMPAALKALWRTQKPPARMKCGMAHHLPSMRCSLRAGGVQLAVELLQVLLERVDVVDDVQEVQLRRAQRVDEHVGRVASLDGGGQLLDDVAGAGVGLDVRVVERIVLLSGESLILASIRALWSGWKSRDWTTCSLPLILAFVKVGTGRRACERRVGVAAARCAGVPRRRRSVRRGGRSCGRGGGGGGGCCEPSRRRGWLGAAGARRLALRPAPNRPRRGHGRRGDEAIAQNACGGASGDATLPGTRQLHPSPNLPGLRP